MAMMPQPMSLHVIHGRMRREWCEKCLVSEAVWDVYVVGDSELAVTQIGTVRECDQTDR